MSTWQCALLLAVTIDKNRRLVGHFFQIEHSQRLTGKYRKYACSQFIPQIHCQKHAAAGIKAIYTKYQLNNQVETRTAYLFYTRIKLRKINTCFTRLPCDAMLVFDIFAGEYYFFHA